jgi:hypothetical protein
LLAKYRSLLFDFTIIKKRETITAAAPYKMLFPIARFEVFTAVTMKNAVFWDVAPCRSCVNRRFGGTYSLHLQGRKIAGEEPDADACSPWFLARRFFYPEDGGDTFLRNVGSHKIYTAPHPRGRHSSLGSWLRIPLEAGMCVHSIPVSVSCFGRRLVLC